MKYLYFLLILGQPISILAYAYTPLKSLSNTYKTDDKRAYFMGDPVLHSDAKTFELIQIDYPHGSRWSYTHYAKDKNHFYINGKIVYGIKPKNLVWLKDGWFKDEELIIFNGYPVFDFNPTGFELIDFRFLRNNGDIYFYLLPPYDSTKDPPTYWIIDNIKAPQDFSPINGEYYHDLTTVYYLDFHNNQVTLVETDADINSFEYKEIDSDNYQKEYDYWDKNGPIIKGKHYE